MDLCATKEKCGHFYTQLSEVIEYHEYPEDGISIMVNQKVNK